MGTPRSTAERARHVGSHPGVFLLGSCLCSSPVLSHQRGGQQSNRRGDPCRRQQPGHRRLSRGTFGGRVCPLVAVGSDGRSQVSARGNRGPGLTGSNGNAGPVNAAGQAYDPAAETYKKQIEAYTRWAEQQVENAKNQLGTAGK